MNNTHLICFIAAARKYQYRKTRLSDFTSEVTNACFLEADLSRLDAVKKMRTANNHAFDQVVDGGPMQHLAKKYKRQLMDRMLLQTENLPADLVSVTKELFARAVRQRLISDAYQRDLVKKIERRIAEQQARIA